MNTKIKIILSFIITAIILTMLMPVKGVYKYKYTAGDKWAYSDLSSDFEFQILKTDEELNRDYEIFEKEFVDIYKLDREISNNVFTALLKKYNISLKNINSDGRDNLSENQKRGVLFYNLLSDIYETGIIDNENINKGIEVIRLIKDGTISPVVNNEFYSVESATNYVNEELSNRSISDANIDLYSFVKKNVFFDEILTSELKNKERSEISISKGFLPKGAILIKKGDLVDDNKIITLNSYKFEYEKRSTIGKKWRIVVGNFMHVAMLLSLSYVFLVYFRVEFSKKIRNILFILFIYIAMMGFTSFVAHFDILSFYMIPYAIIPMYIITFYDMRMSIFEFVITLLLCVSITPIPFDLIFLNLTAGTAATFVIRDSYKRKKVFKASALMLLIYTIGYISLKMAVHQNISTINWSELIWFIANIGVFLMMYQLVYLFEKIFGFVTNITLFELCDTNRALLQELAQKAPGTFQHSLQVANLAEAAAKEIGANFLLARTGALYHDIGKMTNPGYFIENTSGEYNPHDKLEPLKSVEYIKQHVTDGLKLAKKDGLPSTILNFIVSHHGTSKIFYFYHSYVSKYGEPVDDSLFLYEGNVPISKEESICMIVDSVEAASRSMQQYTLESITSLIDKIINTQITEGQLDESQLSIKEILQIKKVLINKLLNIYHTRIEYPKR